MFHMRFCCNKRVILGVANWDDDIGDTVRITEVPCSYCHGTPYKFNAKNLQLLRELYQLDCLYKFLFCASFIPIYLFPLRFRIPLAYFLFLHSIGIHRGTP
jgi:hypothetical protein